LENAGYLDQKPLERFLIEAQPEPQAKAWGE